jgi:hypothetical protein
MPAALAGLDRIQQRHGSLDVVNNFKRWDQQLRDNPAEYARVGQEIANNINDSVGMQQAHAIASEYQQQRKISDEERAVMSRVLQSGEANNLPVAHAYARYELATDIKDSHERDVVAAQRQLEGPKAFFARVAVFDFERRHPQARQDRKRWSRMRELLDARKAQTLDEAWAAAAR